MHGRLLHSHPRGSGANGRNVKSEQRKSKSRMNQTKRQPTEIYLAAVLVPLGAFVGFCLFFGHPSEYVWLPSCPFHALTGLYCPGCGTLRAIHYLLNGQFGTAFRYQPLLISLSPILLLLAGKVGYENLRNRTVTLPFEVQLYWLILIAVCLFFVLRNVPLDCFECLRPPKTM